jgi:uncharacterized SAM-binding protein YcdF (DUF218 family)
MYRFFSQLLEPYTLFCVLLALIVVHLWWRRRETRGRLVLLTIPAAGLFLMSSPYVAHLILGTLEWQYDRLDKRPVDVDAIVVLGGGIKWPDAGRPEPELGLDTTSRCVQAAQLYHDGKPCPVVVSGGKEYPDRDGPSAAQVMRNFLVKLRVPSGDIVLEGTSQSTYENAVECRKVLERLQARRIALVTERTHMVRAVGCFRKQGIDVVPSPCRLNATEFSFEAAALLPNPRAAQACQRVFHEWIGLIWYGLHGRI